MSAKSEAQRKAMYAAAAGHSTLGIPQSVGKEFIGKDSRAAGVCLMAEDGQALFLKRGADSDHAGTWCFPGGGAEDGETPEQAARRELREECGASPYGDMEHMHHAQDDASEFVTFKQPVKHKFTPRLNDEHAEHVWADLNNPPKPLHPGVKMALDEIAYDAEFKEGDHPRAENGQFGSGGGNSKELNDAEKKQLDKFKKAELAIKEKLKTGENLNSNEKYLIDNKVKLEDKFGVKFHLSDEATKKSEIQKKESDIEREKSENARREQRAKNKEQERQYQIKREDRIASNLHTLDKSIQSGNVEVAAKASMQRAIDIGYPADIDEFNDVNDNETPVPYRAGAALAALNKYGWTTDNPPINNNDESFYFTATKGNNTIKVRVANHGNTTSLYAKPWINISPGEDTISDIEGLLGNADEHRNLSVDYLDDETKQASDSRLAFDRALIKDGILYDKYSIPMFDGIVK